MQTKMAIVVFCGVLAGGIGAGCGGDPAGDRGASPGGALADASGDAPPGADAQGAVDDAGGAPSDVAIDPAPDTASRPPDAGAQADAAGASPDVALPTGDTPLGEPCAVSAECQSGLCLQYGIAVGCTRPCEAMADCADLGMWCLQLGPGTRGCVPQLVAGGDCAGNQGCDFPLRCRADTGACALAECLWDGDCKDGETCEPWSRRCQVKACEADLQCKHPAERCVDGACGPPACETDADCPDGLCQPVQKQCITPVACEDQDGCFYNELCDGGVCHPNPCYAGCSADQVCNPKTGACGAACIGVGPCPSGQACGALTGCYPNTAPLADIRVAGETAAVVAVGESVSLDGQGSVDPEGSALTFEWVVLVAPSPSALSPGASLGAGPTAALSPDVAGTFAVGLRVQDEGALWSMQAQAVIVAQ